MNTPSSATDTMNQQPQADDKTSVEDGLRRLEELVESLESGDLPLEKAMKAFEEGAQLSAKLRQSLKSAEERLHILKSQATGEDVREEFAGEGQEPNF